LPLGFEAVRDHLLVLLELTPLAGLLRHHHLLLLLVLLKCLHLVSFASLGKLDYRWRQMSHVPSGCQWSWV
jgi:hypothetical protein